MPLLSLTYKVTTRCLSTQLATWGRINIWSVGGAETSAEGESIPPFCLSCSCQQFSTCFQIPQFKDSTSWERGKNSHNLKQYFFVCLQIWEKVIEEHMKLKTEGLTIFVDILSYPPFIWCRKDWFIKLSAKQDQTTHLLQQPGPLLTSSSGGLCIIASEIFPETLQDGQLVTVPNAPQLLQCSFGVCDRWDIMSLAN